jgi:hypothetical protein
MVGKGDERFRKLTPFPQLLVGKAFAFPTFFPDFCQGKIALILSGL